MLAAWTTVKLTGRYVLVVVGKAAQEPGVQRCRLTQPNTYDGANPMQLVAYTDTVEDQRQGTRNQAHSHGRESHFRFANTIVLARETIGYHV